MEPVILAESEAAMSAPQFRDNYYAGLGASHQFAALPCDTLNATPIVAVSAQGAGKKIRLKAFLFTAKGDITGDPVSVNFHLEDGTTAILGLGSIGGATNTVLTPAAVNTYVTLPGEGITGTANTAMNVQASADETNVDAQITCFFDVVS
jgi:hypothetical protein